MGASAARFYHMLSAASSCGEYEKVSNGEFFLVATYIQTGFLYHVVL